MFDDRNKTAPSNIQDLFQDISNVHWVFILTMHVPLPLNNNFYTKPFRLPVQANSFSRIGVTVWDEIP